MHGLVRACYTYYVNDLVFQVQKVLVSKANVEVALFL